MLHSWCYLFCEFILVGDNDGNSFLCHFINVRLCRADTIAWAVYSTTDTNQQPPYSHRWKLQPQQWRCGILHWAQLDQKSSSMVSQNPFHSYIFDLELLLELDTAWFARNILLPQKSNRLNSVYTIWFGDYHHYRQKLPCSHNFVQLLEHCMCRIWSTLSQCPQLSLENCWSSAAGGSQRCHRLVLLPGVPSATSLCLGPPGLSSILSVTLS